ncbi:MAG: glycosyltransferase family 39 protein [Phycisphaerae bacterium]|jgi:hypothetical protein
MCAAFPAWRLISPRDTYILHLSDDAFYYLSVAPRLAAGQGPTADGLTRTTGWHPLYGFVLAGLHKLTSPSLDGFVKQAIALVSLLYLLSAYFLYQAAAVGWGRSAGMVAALLWLCNPFAVLITQQGLESGLYAYCLSMLLWRLARFVRQSDGTAGYLRACLELGVAGGLVVLSRTDAVLLMPIVALIVLSRGRAAETPPDTPAGAQPGVGDSGLVGAFALRRHALGIRLLGVGVFSLSVAAAYGIWLFYVWRHTGELQQGSAAIKMQWRRFEMADKTALGVLLATLTMWGEFVGKSLFKVPAFKWVLTGLPILRRRAASAAQRGLLHLLWIVPVGLGLAYGLLLDWTRSWYYLPGLLTLTLLSAGAAGVFLTAPGPMSGAPGTSAPGSAPPAGRPERFGVAYLQRLVARKAGLIAWAVVIESAVVFSAGVFKEARPGGGDSEKTWSLRAAGWLVKNARPGERIGVWHSGIIGYYTPGLEVINLDGLNNNDILAVVRGRKTLNEYWDEAGITAVILPFKRDDKMGRFDEAWDGKRLVPWIKSPAGRHLAGSLNVDDQVFGQRIHRIVPVEPTATTPASP